ncbi:hypothetical protein [Leucobacter sp. wl10]|uniref:hypothetical protein n=1 Tax=Leucobacter sp. wl10 TaxID=2304677 RepID=UPI000E5A4517|nr:hypothetical protein [Leucobacter sp. wl10]RGE18085.1 hypothetical protein D1J51_15160 [Leucobacter sp. wl10]
MQAIRHRHRTALHDLRRVRLTWRRQTLQMLQLGLAFVVLAAICDSVWVLAASAERACFGSSPKRMAALGATGGGFVIALGRALLFSGPRQLSS